MDAKARPRLTQSGEARAVQALFALEEEAHKKQGEKEEKHRTT